MEFVISFGSLINNLNSESTEEKESDVISGINFSSFTKSGGLSVKEENPDKKTTRSKKKTTEVIYEAKNDKSDNNYSQSDYMSSYNKTNALLESAIIQTDQLSAEIKADIESIRSSKTLKNKYTYITNLTSSSAALIGNKIQAIREINNTISQSHKLELDRMKAIKADEKDQTDEGRMMDLYKAFVNTPVGTYTSPTVPSIGDMATGNNTLGIGMGDIPNIQLTPEQARMRMENNPNIITVVKFNQSTGQRYFDVIDRTNGASIPNFPRPDDFLLDNTNIDIRSMSARNKNLDTVWPLVLIGNGDITEY